MANDFSLLSHTLQSITTTKKREQDKRRNTLEACKIKLLHTIDASEDQSARLEALLSGFQALSLGKKGVGYVDQDQETSIQNMKHYLEQSGYDQSIPVRILHRFEVKVREKLF